MYIDAVIPNKNEGKFAEIAERLGYSSLCFLYPGEIPKENLSSSKLHIYAGTLYPNAKGEIVFFESKGDDRGALENPQIDSIFSLEGPAKRDFLHHRASGLNHIMCDIARKERKIIVFNLTMLLSKNKPLILGRMIQNTHICRKYRVETAIASFAKSPYQMRSPHDLISLFSTLGMHPEDARKSLQSLEKKIKENQKRKEHGFYSEKIRILDQ